MFEHVHPFGCLLGFVFCFMLGVVVVAALAARPRKATRP